MGLLATRWEAEHEGHAIVVARNEWTKGFSLEWDGEEIARRRWSWIGLGELHATAEIEGRPVDVRVLLHGFGLSNLDGQCTLTVDGAEVPVTKVK